jgi:meprin A
MGTYDPSCDCYHGWTWGWNAYFSHYHLNSRSYLKNDDLILFIEFEGAPDYFQRALRFFGDHT